MSAAEIAAAGSVSKFVAGLARSVNAAPDEVCCWTTKGDAFVIADAARFIQVHKKNTRFESLIRQLHYYGFAKDKRTSDKTWRFSHMFFQKGKPWLLHRIVRQTQPKKSAKGKGAPVELTVGPTQTTRAEASAETARLREEVQTYKLESGKQERRIEQLQAKVRQVELSRDRVVESMQRMGQDEDVLPDRKLGLVDISGLLGRPHKRQKANGPCTKDQASNTDSPPSPASSVDYNSSQEEDRARAPRFFGLGMEAPRTLVRTKSSSSNFAGMFSSGFASRSSSTSSIPSEPPKEGLLSRGNSFNFNEVAFNMRRDMPTPPPTFNMGFPPPFFQPPSRVSRMKSFTREMDSDASAALNEFVASSNEDLPIDEPAGISSKVHMFMEGCCDDAEGAKSEVSRHGVLSDQETKHLAQLLVNSPQIKIESLINHIIQESHLSGRMKVPVAEEVAIDM
jgi:hypothetical protein